jgi:hypothetical protein
MAHRRENTRASVFVRFARLCNMLFSLEKVARRENARSARGASNARIVKARAAHCFLRPPKYHHAS